ncbi:TonB-dependent receptor plug domain-containing protein [Phascolarctobacterium succinatutens]|uniref:TonB-dependent receptor plug domain-containing protein n=2 Tax=Phascolarctobacterium succinatutens TaxID=626940 RepID=UPI00260D74A4|nr:TonB-dependent receptor plug domain-containing protein [uncultured Phascolarctobacterium sp.]
MKNINGQNILAAAIAVSLGCSLTEFLPAAYAAPTDTAQTASNDADDSLMDFSLDTMTVEAKRPDWESKLSPGTVNIVRPDEFKGEQKSLPDLLLTVPGVHVREVNGKGQYTTVTMRGSTAAQVGIFIDGVLANLGGDTAVDLSTIPVKNVERIEVYRGYIPSRFGGTFMGGVINIVTKKPETTNVSLEVGKSSYGGKRGSMEITAPLGDGSLMVGTNYESSDGDFKYKNYAAERYLPYGEQQIAGQQKVIDNFNNETIDYMTKGAVINLQQEQIDYYKANNDAWLGFVRSDSLKDAIYDNRYEYAKKDVGNSNLYLIEQQVVDRGLKDEYLKRGYDDSDWHEALQYDWIGSSFGEGVLTPEIKEEILKEYGDKVVQNNIDKWTNDADPDKNKNQAGRKESLEKLKQKQKEAENATRYRKYNDYEKTSTIVKWQNKNWVIKGTYDTLDRHMPDSVWLGDVNAAVYNNGVDLSDRYYYDSRRQKQNSASLMLQNRQEVGKLEWGWMLDYMYQNKKYRAEHINTAYPNSEWDMQNQPLREWSRYKSNKYTAQIDGGYKLNDNNMLDFLINYSKEGLDIDGSNMAKILGGQASQNFLSAQIRNRYEQELFNVQLQDSITLDKEGTWIFTPSVRYNQSKITGFSDGKRFTDGQASWIHPKDSQTKGKATWQLALKKEVNENLTLRMTGGTYYRLLNMAEIAGDGAGILPAPRNHNGEGAMFPVPEEGKQFDISAIMHNKLLGADNSTTLTYYWRDSTNMLQLERAGKDYWSYFNDNKGKSHGIELQSSFKWNKFDLDLQVTYLNTSAYNKHTATQFGEYAPVWPTYQPEWEGNIRLTYRPSEKFSLFAEGHYTDEYFTYYNKATSGKLSPYLSGKPVCSLFVMNSGLKWMPKKNWQLTFGCNDILNKGPKSKIRSDAAFMVPGYINPEFPIQGRTYYVTARYQF